MMKLDSDKYFAKINVTRVEQFPVISPGKNFNFKLISILNFKVEWYLLSKILNEVAYLFIKVLKQK